MIFFIIFTAKNADLSVQTNDLKRLFLLLIIGYFLLVILALMLIKKSNDKSFFRKVLCKLIYCAIIFKAYIATLFFENW
ncbi:Uncharacterised protein, partial [Mycoplasmoides gallisepticum]